MGGVTYHINTVHVCCVLTGACRRPTYQPRRRPASRRAVNVAMVNIDSRLCTLYTFIYVKRNVYSLNIGVFSCLCELVVHDDAVRMSYQAREVTCDPVTAPTCSDVRPTDGTSLLPPLRPLQLGSLGCHYVCQIFKNIFACL